MRAPHGLLRDRNDLRHQFGFPDPRAHRDELVPHDVELAGSVAIEQCHLLNLRTIGQSIGRGRPALTAALFEYDPRTVPWLPPSYGQKLWKAA
jgi:hypothetical protein